MRAGLTLLICPRLNNINIRVWGGGNYHNSVSLSHCFTFFYYVVKIVQVFRRFQDKAHQGKMGVACVWSVTL